MKNVKNQKLKIVKIKKWYSDNSVETIKINQDGIQTKTVVTKKESK